MKRTMLGVAIVSIALMSIGSGADALKEVNSSEKAKINSKAIENSKQIVGTEHHWYIMNKGTGGITPSSY